MCGIIGVVGDSNVALRLLDGLRRLEYRGYDSAGIATVESSAIHRRRAEGKIVNLEQRMEVEPLAGDIGIAHTRWATHGAANETNAHPHSDGHVAIVHNGIIENFQALRARLEEQGHKFETETDSEVIVHLISSYRQTGLDHTAAAHAAIKDLQGAYALAILFADQDNLLVGARKGSPLAVGVGEGEMFLGSDALALAPLTQQICYLEEGDWVVLTRDSMQVYNVDGAAQEREVKQTALTGALVGKGNHRHFMIKEIYEQPQVIGDTLHVLLNANTRTAAMPEFPFSLADIPQVTIVACGTSYLAGLVTKYWIEQLARVPVDVDIGSEFRYREPPLPKDGLAIFISQSGETADTLAPLHYCKKQGQHILSVVNVAESEMARVSDAVLLTKAGPEVGVASTKAFTTQLSVLAAFAIALARAKGAIDLEREQSLMMALTEVPAKVSDILDHEKAIEGIAAGLQDAKSVLYLARGQNFPIAMEGALKLKEISYIHAEGYAAGEMKHGPIALIDEHMPVIVIAPSDSVFDKTLSNIQQVVARKGKVIALTDKAGAARIGSNAVETVIVPDSDPFVAPILYAIPVQLLAYHTAVLKGTDVDQPRNLAKSVTVE
jgi:glutamine---fructose-6-phosphate transaminase (isomerizing)